MNRSGEHPQVRAVGPAARPLRKLQATAFNYIILYYIVLYYVNRSGEHP